MNEQFKILHIEDNVDDAELLKIQLEKLEEEYQYTLIPTLSELEAHLTEGHVDLIISDYMFNGFTGDDVLSLTRAMNERIPIILVSGYVDFKKAVNMLVTGANDFIMKDELERISHTAKREIQNYRASIALERERNRALQDLETKVKQQHFLHQISQLDEQALLIEGVINKVIEQLPAVWQFPEITEVCIEYNGKVYRTGKCPDSDPSIFGTNSSIRKGPLSINVFYIQDSQDESRRQIVSDEEDLIDSLLDILSLKINSVLDLEELNRKQDLLDRANELAKVGQWEVDLKTRIMKWSPQLYDIHEVDEDFDTKIENGINFYKEGKHRDRIAELWQRAVEYGEPYDEDMLIVTGKGREKWVRVIARPVFREGECIKVYGSFQDIDDLKRSNIHLENTERKLRDILEHSTNLFYRHDSEHFLRYVSPQSEEFLGYKPSDGVFRWTDFLTDHPINEIGIEITNKALETGDPQPPYTLQIQQKGGGVKWVQVNEAPIVENGKAVAIVGSLTDITELVEVGKENHLLSKVASETQNLVIITDKYQNILWVNNAFEKVTGYSLESVKGKSPSLLQGPDTSKDTIAYISKKIEERVKFSAELLNYTKQGDPYWINMNVTPILDENQEVVQYFSIQEDITQRKEFEAEIQRQRERLLQAQKIGKIGDWEFDVARQKIYWSPMLFNIYERDPELGEPNINQLQEYYPSQKEFFLKSVQLAIEEGVPYDFDIELQTEKNNTKYVHVEGIPISENGSVTKLLGIVQDITDRKFKEEELRKTQMFYDLAVEGTGVGLWELNLDTYDTFFNHTYFSMLGYTEDQVVFNKEFFDKLIHPVDEVVIENHLKKIHSGIEDSFEEIIRMKHKDGSYRWLLDRAKVVRYENDKPKTLAGSHLDITEQVQASQGLERERDRLLKAQEIANIGDWDYDVKSGDIVWSPTMFKIFEREPESGQPAMEEVIDYFSDEATEKVLSNIMNSVNTGQGYASESTIITSSGKQKHIFTECVTIMDDDGHVEMLHGTTQDITDRKKIEIQLLKALEEKTVLIEEIHHRVKNNLAIIAALIHLQLADLEEDSYDRLPLEKAITRINTIASVHELLYQRHSFSEVSATDYINQLVNQCMQTFSQKATVNTSIEANDLIMNVNELVPVGLLLNELITNSIKYAFQGREKGFIGISLSENSTKYQLRYKDDGVGFKEKDFHDPEFSGIKIVQTLLQQIDATYTVQTDNQFCMNIEFPKRKRGAHSLLEN